MYALPHSSLFYLAIHCCVSLFASIWDDVAIPNCKLVQKESAGQPKLTTTHHGSNSWMMLSNRMTAKSRDENPQTQARKRMAKVIKLE